MKFTILSVLALGASATVVGDTPSHVERDLPTITGVINSVGSKLNDLDMAAQAYNGGDVTALVNAGNALKDTTAQGITTVQGTSQISLNEAVSLQPTVTTLQNTANKLVNDLAAKKPQIQQASMCSVVRDQSTQLNDQSRQLIDAMTSKVPTGAQAIAAQLASGFTKALQTNQATWANGNCTDAGGSSTSPSAPSNTSSPTTTGGAGTGATSSATGAGGARPSNSATSGATLNLVSWGSFAAAVFAGLWL